MAHRRYRLQPGGDLEVELAAEGIALPVMSRGHVVGRFILDFGPGAGATLEQRIVAIALADQVAASLAAYPVGSTARPPRLIKTEAAASPTPSGGRWASSARRA